MIFIGFNITFFTQFMLGSKGMPRRYYSYIPEFQSYHMISTFGSWILAAGFLVMAFYFVESLLNGKKAPANPWGSKTLEWQTESPPVLENFYETPVVTTKPYNYESREDA